MKKPGINLIKKFYIEEKNLDFMGYEPRKDEILTFHHLIIPSCEKGPYEECNGVILCGNTSHPCLHIIEGTDYDMFLDITSEMLYELIKGYLDRENLLRIRDILNSFEKEYLDGSLCNYKIKEDYLIRPSVNKILTRKK